METSDLLHSAHRDVSCLMEELGGEFLLSRYGLEMVPASVFAVSAAKDNAHVWLHGLLVGAAYMECLQRTMEEA